VSITPGRTPVGGSDERDEDPESRAGEGLVEEIEHVTADGRRAHDDLIADRLVVGPVA
jgi:hypothetical protein